MKTTNMKFNTLSTVQKKTYDFIKKFISENGYAPSLKDIANHINVKSISTAFFHLERLAEKGFIVKGENGSIELINQNNNESSESSMSLTNYLENCQVPLVGIIAAGVPIEAIENTNTMITIPPSMIDGKGEVFCLEVQGNSMIDAHICDEDIVVVKKQDYAENGQIVVALLDDGSATLKTYKKLKNGQVMLIPANKDFVPITLDSVKVQGKVIGIIREMH
ncbi:MAG: transcriptional repressor LexA [Bdellovibrionota bacterium]|nr:transcriptional repressor LexA [Pseudomonadota bacterium]MDY6090261.1 transcriptional repressor LexA [Bdellovibrionota bacterium]